MKNNININNICRMGNNTLQTILKSTSLLINQIGRDDGKEKNKSLEKTSGKKSLQGKT